jgi:hypothetical protein
VLLVGQVKCSIRFSAALEPRSRGDGMFLVPIGGGEMCGGSDWGSGLVLRGMGLDDVAQQARVNG